MIEINLLPEELKPRRTKEDVLRFLGAAPDDPFRWKRYAVLAAGGIVALQLALLTASAVRNAQRSAFEKRYLAVLAEQREALDVKARIALAKDAAVRSRQIQWGEQLDAIRQAMVPGLWLAGLSYRESGGMDDAGTLRLSGYVYAPRADPRAAVDRFAEGLERNTAFSSAFPRVTVEDTEKTTFEGYDVLSFAIASSRER